MLARYKLPRRVEFTDAMPRDPNGKLYKRTLRDPYWVGRERAHLTVPREESRPMARVPIEEGYFRIPDDPDAPPVLLGSKCPNCGEVFFPRRMVCAKCLHEGTDDVDLSTRGTSLDVDVLRDPAVREEGHRRAGLRRRARSTCRRARASRRSCWAVPTTSRSAWSSSSTSRPCNTNRDGDDVVIYRFRPLEGSTR